MSRAPIRHDENGDPVYWVPLRKRLWWKLCDFMDHGGWMLLTLIVMAMMAAGAFEPIPYDADDACPPGLPTYYC